MANQQGNGRKVALPDENRPSWRPQDENGARDRRLVGDREDRERLYRNDREDDYLRDRERFGSYWDDRSSRWDRDEGYRSSERYGQGQSGYGGGRYEEDRSYSSRNSAYPGELEDRPRERGVDERWSRGRGGPRWSERDEDYGQGRTYGSPPIGAAQAGWNQQRMYPADRPVGYESPYREPGMHSREGMRQQTRYGSQGYQGWGQQGQVSHRGKGPAGYMRSDERIREMVCEALTEDHNVDATNIEVSVKNGEVTLSGTVEDRMQKRMAEDCVEQLAGVRDVHNQIRIGVDQKASGKEAESSPTQDKRPRA
ncbi:MAG TPA: BON domain-containing protein [Kofleriaceae bacterium]|nr:BON domain-containing protein [Kofleriaceae bacterium]